MDPTSTLPLLPKREPFFDFWLVIHQLLLSITQGEHELQLYFGSFTNNIQVEFIQQVYAATKSVTSNGGASIDTSQFVFGGASGKFVASSSQYLMVPNSSDFNGWASDFTVDFWVRFNSLPTAGNYMQFYDYRNPSTSNIFTFNLYNNSGMMALGFFIDTGGSSYDSISFNTTLSTSVWYHMGLVHSGTTYYIFQNGTLLGSGTSSRSPSGITDTLFIGKQDGGTGYFDGWIDEYRVSKVARWTSGFTPPAAAYVSDGNTVLLLHMDGTNGSTTFIDDSLSTGPVSFGFSVKASATQIVVTLMYSWTGSGAPPQGIVSIADPSGNPTRMESGAVVYDRTSISVAGIGSTYNLIHRVTFTLTAPGSAQVWTAYVSLAGVSSYTVTIEVS
jgi:hypothetical protein